MKGELVKTDEKAMSLETDMYSVDCEFSLSACVFSERGLQYLNAIIALSFQSVLCVRAPERTTDLST